MVCITILACLVAKPFVVYADPSANGILQLSEDGEYITLCGLPEVGLLLMESASIKADSLKNHPEMVFRIKCDYASQLLQHGKTNPARSLLDSLVPPGRNSSDQPLFQRLLKNAPEKYHVRQSILIACGHLALNENRPADTLNIAEKSARLATDNKRMGDESEALYLQAMAYRELNRIELVEEKAKESIARFRITGHPLKEVQVRQMLSRVYARTGNYRLARFEMEKAMKVIPDYSVAPLSDLKTNIENIEKLQNEHHQLANRGLYNIARNQVITLLIIKKRADAIIDPEQKKAVKSAKLYEGPLLAYLARYSLAIGRRSTAESLLPTIAAFENLRPGSRIRAEYAWAAAGLLYDLGFYKEADKQLQKAESLLRQVKDLPAFLTVGVYEWRAKIEFKEQNIEQARKTMNKAIETARKANLTDHVLFLENQLEHMVLDNLPKTDVNVFYTTAEALMRREIRQEKATDNATPEIFRSAYVKDYSAMASAAESINKENLNRPSPPPIAVRFSASDRMQMGQYDRAAKILEEEIEKNGPDVNRLMMLGSCYYQLRNWRKASVAYQKVLDIDPENAAATQRLKFIKSRME